MYFHHLCIIARFRGLPLSNGEAVQPPPLPKCYNGVKEGPDLPNYLGDAKLAKTAVEI